MDRGVIVVEQVAHQLVAQGRSAAAEDDTDQTVTTPRGRAHEAEAGAAGVTRLPGRPLHRCIGSSGRCEFADDAVAFAVVDLGIALTGHFGDLFVLQHLQREPGWSVGEE